ncbi:MAG: pentapeptide repeat-containing protein [Polaribacter sp.]
MKSKITFLSICLFLTSVVSFSQKTVNASDILKDIKNGKSINIKNATIVGVFDLTYMDEALKKLPKRTKKSWWGNSKNNDNVIKKLIETKVSFQNCIFKDDVLAYIPHEDSGYTFTASFEEEAIFKACTFQGKAMFKYSRFEKDSDFSKSIFEDDNTFKYAKFDKNSNFSNTVFKEAATFKYAKFERNVSFANALFKDAATFKYTKFFNGVSFNNTNFEENLNIKYANINGSFDIKNMKVAYDIDSKHTKINGKSFSKYLISNK